MKAFFYFVPWNGNFGDELVPLIINKLLPKQNPVFYKNTIPIDNKLKIMTSIGSIIHLIPNGSYVWGTGHNPNKNNVPQDLKVFGTRGPISMNYLNKHGYKLNNDISFGDPALLIPRLFPEWIESKESKKYDVTIIPHHNDVSIINHNNILSKNNIIYCHHPIHNIISSIKSSEIIVSSSLHGIILSEMLGKKTFWLQLENSKKTETDQKYLDYYYSTNRYNISPITTIDEVFSKTYISPQYDDTKLYESFYECFEA